jgi:hypothetical protein
LSSDPLLYSNKIKIRKKNGATNRLKKDPHQNSAVEKNRRRAEADGGKFSGYHAQQRAHTGQY